VPRALGEGLPQPCGEFGILQHERTLQIPIAVQAGCQPKVPFEERPGLPEQIENGGGIHMNAGETGEWLNTGGE